MAFRISAKHVIPVALWLAAGCGGSVNGGETHWLGDCDARPDCDGGVIPGAITLDDGGGRSPTCGDGVIDRGESCDGESFRGETCASATMNTMPLGQLLCANCELDVRGCFSESEPYPAAGGTGGTGGRPGGTGGRPGGTGGRPGGTGGRPGGTGGHDPGTGGMGDGGEDPTGTGGLGSFDSGPDATGTGGLDGASD